MSKLAGKGFRMTDRQTRNYASDHSIWEHKMQPMLKEINTLEFSILRDLEFEKQ